MANPATPILEIFMRKMLLSAAILATLSSPALAHPEHDEMPRPVVRKPMAEVASSEVIKLVTQAKLPASWSSAKATKTETKIIRGAQRWVVTCQNSAIKSASKRTLYVVLAQNGDFVSYSYTPV